MRAITQRRDRGFTLIEVMVTLAMTSVVMASMFGAMIAQQRSYATQMEASEATQNARAALTILKDELRMAGWGIDGNVGATFPPVGTCNNTVDATVCNNLPTLGDPARTSDRLRMVAMSPSRFDDQTDWDSSGARLRSFPKSVYAEADAPGLLEDTLAILDGECDDGTRFTSAAVIKSPGTETLFWHSYTLDPPPAGMAASPCTDYNNGVRLSSANVVDYYVDHSEESPRLMRHWNPGAEDGFGAANSAEVVAYGIDSLQVQYGIDTGMSNVEPRPDQQIDIWCDDLTNCDTTGVSTTAFTTAELSARVVAVRLAVVSVAPTSAGDLTTDYNVFDGLIPADGQRRWVYRATVRLRNNEVL